MRRTATRVGLLNSHRAGQGIRRRQLTIEAYRQLAIRFGLEDQSAEFTGVKFVWIPGKTGDQPLLIFRPLLFVLVNEGGQLLRILRPPMPVLVVRPQSARQMR